MNGRSWDEKVEERIVERGEKYEGRFKCGEEREVWVDKGNFSRGKDVKGEVKYPEFSKKQKACCFTSQF